MKKIKLCLILVLSLVMAFVFIGCNMGSEGDDTSFATAQELIELAKNNTKSSSTIDSNTQKGTPNFTVPAGGYDGSEVEITFYHTMGSNLSDVLH